MNKREWAQEKKREDPDYFKKLGAKGGAQTSGYEFAHGKVSPTVAIRKRWNARDEQKPTTDEES